MIERNDWNEAATRNLIQQTAEGNEQAFEELCRTYRAALRRQALHIVGNIETAEEVVQDALLGIWHGAKHFKGDAKPFTWMWAIVRNKAITVLRSRARFSEISDDENIELAWPSNPEMDAVMTEALEGLSLEHRLAIVLTYYLNLSQEQVSRLMHCPLGTVKSRVSIALNQLRDFWQVTPSSLSKEPGDCTDFAQVRV